jgi:MoaA/NifB/PqqE/SkfB family radical SAM enzyme
MNRKVRNNIPELIYGKKVWFIRKRLTVFLFWQLLKTIKNPIVTLREVTRVRKLRNSVHGKTNISKFVKSDNQYYWAADFSGFPSNNLKHMIRSEFRRNDKRLKKSESLLIPQQTIIWGITNRCPLKCKHCYDWDNIDTKDHLDLVQLKQILSKIELQGIRHVQLSGGEPLSRFNDLISILKEASKRIDFWLLTSGYGLTIEKAVDLKKSGLKGVNISLDHWKESAHNDFRNSSKSFKWVIKAVENCRNAGIMVSLSLCATREFTTETNLESYLHLAKKINAHFVRILEPRQVGHFSNQKVKLNKDQVELLSKFTIRMNTHPDFNDFPIVVFFGYHQRKLGCMGAGNRYLYIDANGESHACPFCQGSVGNILSQSFNDAIEKLRKNKCHAFKLY